MANLPHVQPRKILVATDLSPRCDRAVDRAIQLAADFGADLVAAHIISEPSRSGNHQRRSWRRNADPLERMRWRLRRDLDATCEKIGAVVEEGDVAERIVQIAAREKCDLIITGDAGPESLRRMLFGSTVNRIVREAVAPVLVVHDRPKGRYRNIVIATDFSEASLRALQLAAAYFPKDRLTLFHAYDIPYAGLIPDRDLKSELREIENEVAIKFMSDARIDSDLRKRAKVVIEHGSPEVLLGDFVDDQGVDLTVIGSHGRGAVFDALIGSNAKRLVESLEGDLLIIRYVEGGEGI